MERKFVNLNHDTLKLALLPSGKHQNIELKIGHKLFYCDINKSASEYALLDFYKKVGSDRTKQSKYGKNSIVLAMQVRRDSVLDRYFFENIKELEHALRICNRYKFVKL